MQRRKEFGMGGRERRVWRARSDNRPPFIKLLAAQMVRADVPKVPRLVGRTVTLWSQASQEWSREKDEANRIVRAHLAHLRRRAGIWKSRYLLEHLL